MAIKYIPIAKEAIPPNVRFDVPQRCAGQIVEVAYGGTGSAQHDAGDPYKRVTDHSDRSVGYYILRPEGAYAVDPKTGEYLGQASLRLTEAKREPEGDVFAAFNRKGEWDIADRGDGLRRVRVEQ